MGSPVRTANSARLIGFPRTRKNFGAGYSYPMIIEDAKVAKVAKK